MMGIEIGNHHYWIETMPCWRLQLEVIRLRDSRASINGLLYGISATEYVYIYIFI